LLEEGAISRGAVIISFTRENYYKSAPEIPARFISEIKNNLTPQDRTLLCARFRGSLIDNLSADLLVSFNDYSIDSIFVTSVLSFDTKGIAYQDTMNYEWLQKSLNSLKLIDSTEYKQGSFQMRLQLEKLCN
jgi:hypothetical protein